MKLHDSAMLSFNRPSMPPSVGPVPSPMPLDSWLTSPISNATPMQTIPGFMGSPQGLQPAYPSHSFLSTPSGMVQSMQPMGPPPYQCPTSFNDKYPMEDDRSSSIAALRMKAKEHIQSMDKTWQHMWSVKAPWTRLSCLYECLQTAFLLLDSCTSEKLTIPKGLCITLTNFQCIFKKITFGMSFISVESF